MEYCLTITAGNKIIEVQTFKILIYGVHFTITFFRCETYDRL